MHTKNAELPSEKGGHDRRVRGAGGVEAGCWTNKLYTIFLARLIFDLFLNFYEFVLCSWLWANKMLTCWGSSAARGVEQGAEYVLCHPSGGRGFDYTLNHKYFPCQQLISLWFICKCEFAFYVFIFIYFIFAPRIQWVSLSGSSALSPLFGFLLPTRGGVNVFFLLLKHPLLLPSSHTHSRVILLPFSCSTFTWLPFSASRFSLSALSVTYFFSVSVRFFSFVFSLPCKTHNNHFNFNAPIIWK